MGIRQLCPVLCSCLLLYLVGCQGSNSTLSNPRPRSRSEAGTNEELPYEASTSERMPIDSDGGELEYRQCRLSVPRGAVPETIFFEIEIPQEPQEDVFFESVYQLNPDSYELERDALLTLAYFDSDIPLGKLETDVVIIHSVNGIWVEIGNSKVNTHNNTVQAPIRYLGLYALRVASEDPRQLNTPPVASFITSGEPFPETEGISLEEAQAQTDPDAEPAEEGDDSEAGEDSASEDSDGKPLPFEGEDPMEYKQRLQEWEDANQAWIMERRVLGGPVSRDAYQSQSEADSAESQPPVPAVLDPDEITYGLDTPEVTVYFNASESYDPDGRVVQYDWDFDSDGIFDYTSHSSPYAEHTFTKNGDYSVALKVTDNGRYSQMGFNTGLVKIRSPLATPEPMSATIAAFPPDGTAPHTVHLASTVTGGVAPYSYLWEFSDDSESILANPYTTYPEAGGHTISYKVVDFEGESLVGHLYIQTSGKEGPVVPLPRSHLGITPAGDSGQAPFKVAFKLNHERATHPVTYRIEFGDEGPGEDLFTTTDETFSHVFTNAGFYLVKIIATDGDLRTATTFATVHALPPSSARDFTASDRAAGGDPFSFGHGMRIGFDYTEASKRTVKLLPHNTPLDLDALAFQWDFGDGNYSTEAKPTHTYATDGVFEIRLTADDGLQRWRHRIWLPVSKGRPAAAIQRPPYIEGPAPLGLSWDVIVTRGEEPLRYDWEFGLARRSDPSTYYSFQLPGDYEINLTAKDKWDEPIYSPPIQVKVRNTAPDYRQPLAVVQPVAGSTRAVVLDYTAANPVPLSSPHIEGPVSMVALSPDGRNIGIVGEDGVVVKRINSALPVLSFLPAQGVISSLAVLNGDAAYCTVDTVAGSQTYLLRPGVGPLWVCEGTLESASSNGREIIVSTPSKKGPRPHFHYNVMVGDGVVHLPEELGKLYAAVLSGDGRSAYVINPEWRLLKLNLANDDEEVLSGKGDMKSNLVVSADGSTVAFTSRLEVRDDIIIGRKSPEGVFRLASLTDQTGFFSEQLALSANGRYLLAFGSRLALSELVARAKEAGKISTDDSEDDGLDGEGMVEDDELIPRPPRRRERFGVIRMDISGSPDSWSMLTINPRFVSESSGSFDNAGPF